MSDVAYTLDLNIKGLECSCNKFKTDCFEERPSCRTNQHEATFTNIIALAVDNLTLLKCQILDSSKLKEFTDDNIKFNDNGDRSPKGIENTMGRGEIARYEQLLLFPQCFQRLVLQACKNKGLFGKGLRLKKHGGKCFFFKI